MFNGVSPFFFSDSFQKSFKVKKEYVCLIACLACRRCTYACIAISYILLYNEALLDRMNHKVGGGRDRRRN